MAFGIGVEVGSGVTVGVGTGVAVGSGVTVGVGTGVAVGSGVTVGVGTGVAVGSGVTVGAAAGVAVGAEVVASVGTVGEGLLVGFEQAAVAILIVQIKSAGRINRRMKYLCFFIKGISVSLVLIIILYLILTGNTAREILMIF